MTVSKITGDLQISGNLRVAGNISGLTRSSLPADDLSVHPILPHQWRKWDSGDALGLLGTAASDDLGIVPGAHGTATPTLQTEDLKAAGATSKYARTWFGLPPEYQSGEDVRMRLSAGMLTTIADTAATVVPVIYKFDREGAVDGANLVTTAAQSINSITLADFDFVINSATLSPGDMLDILLHVVVNDGATGTAVQGIIAATELLIDIRG